MQREQIRGEIIEMQEKLFVASALCAALADLALSAPRPLADRLETLARFARTAVDESLTVASVVIADTAPTSAVAA